MATETIRADQAQTREHAKRPDIAIEATAANDVGLWSDFSTAANAKGFCRAWLAVQCSMVKGAIAGLLLVDDGEGHFSTAAVWPDPTRDLTYLASAAQETLKQRTGFIHQAWPSTAGRGNSHVGHPIDVDGRLRGVIVLDLSVSAPHELPAILRQLKWGAGWMEALFRRQQDEENSAKLSRASFALDVLADATEHEELQAASLAVANYLATRLNCRCVSIGLYRRDHIDLLAISHSAVFQQKAHIVKAIENAMEEAIDQNAAIAVMPPSASGRTPQDHRISLAHQDLAKVVSAHSVASVVIMNAGQSIGAMTFERDTADAFDSRTIELLEAVAVLLGPMFAMKADADRLVAGRLIRRATKTIKALVGPDRPSLKIAAGLLVVAVGYLAIAQGDFRITAKSVVEGAVQRAAVAPFDGYIATAPVRAGDTVEEGQLIAALDDRELVLEAARAKSEFDQQTLRYNDAMAKHDRSAAQIVSATLDQTQAQLALAEDKVRRAKILAPFRGIVVSGDFSQLLGSPIEKGKVLFEIAPLESFRVIIQVDERDIAYVSEGQNGNLVLTGYSATPIPFTVKKVTPVATASDGRNHFRVEADVHAADLQLRPGMEGVAKISIDRRGLLAIWTRSLLDWIRITVWRWSL